MEKGDIVNPLTLFRLVHFVLASGPSIVEQCDALIDFVKQTKARYDASKEESPATPAPNEAAAIASFAGGDNITAIASQCPGISTACERFAIAERNEGSTVGTNANTNLFGDLVRGIIADPERFLNLFLLLKDLFGGDETETPDEEESNDGEANVEEESNDGGKTSV